MYKVVNWLLDIDTIRIDKDAPLLLRWQGSWEPWQLALLFLISTIVVLLIYKRESLPTSKKIILAGIRISIITLVLVILEKPTLIYERNRTEPSYVAVLVDTSSSMSTKDSFDESEVADSYKDAAGMKNEENLDSYSRYEILHRSLQNKNSAPIKKLLEKNNVVFYRFSDETEKVNTLDQTGNDVNSQIVSLHNNLGDITPAGNSSDIPGALRYIIRNMKNRKLSSIIVLSDGQSTDRKNVSSIINRISSAQIPVHTWGAGSTRLPKNIEISDIVAPTFVYYQDDFQIEVNLQSEGITESVSAPVTLISEDDNIVIAEQQVTFSPEKSSQTVSFPVSSNTPGISQYRIELEVLKNEISNADNNRSVSVTVVDKKLNVLYVEGYPRYEYRYLKNALLREKTISLSVLLLEADEEFIQEGTNPIRRFPESLEELQQYDVILFGDVNPRTNWLTVSQMEMIGDYIGNSNAGFGVIAGERYMPAEYINTPLEKLIPVEISNSKSSALPNQLGDGFAISLTPGGMQSRYMELLFDQYTDRTAQTSDDSKINNMNDIVQSLPHFYWTDQNFGPKPGAQVVAHHPDITVRNSTLPVIVEGQYGAGRLFYQGTDDVWRWRRHTGEWLVDAYWVQVVRHLASQNQQNRNQPFSVQTDKKQYQLGETVTATIQINDVNLFESIQDKINLEITNELGILYDKVSIETKSFNDDNNNSFKHLFTPLLAGKFKLELPEFPAQLENRSGTTGFEVVSTSKESLVTQADHEFLRFLSSNTDGIYIEPGKMTETFSTIKNNSITIPDDIEESLWDSKLSLILFLLLISLDWSLRKYFNLV